MSSIQVRQFARSDRDQVRVVAAAHLLLDYADADDTAAAAFLESVGFRLLTRTIRGLTCSNAASSGG